jgi:hypothetical protein
MIGIDIFLTIAPTAISMHFARQGETGSAAHFLAFAFLCALILWIGHEMRFRPRRSGDDPIRITEESAATGAPWERKQPTKLWRQDRLPRIPSDDDNQGYKPAIHIEGKYLAADPALVLTILTFYWKNPDARTELNTESALRRARSGAFAR